MEQDYYSRPNREREQRLETRSSVQTYEKNKYFGLIFAYAGIGFLISAIVALITGFLVARFDTSGELYYGLIIGSSVIQIVLIFYISFVVFRRQKRMVVPFVIYAIVMGVLLSSILFILDWYTIGVTLALTCLVFGIMAAVGYFSKANLSSLVLVGLGLLVGSIFLSLFNFFIGSETITWIVTFVSFGAIMLITAFDVWRIRREIESGIMDKQRALFHAFSIYIDFIYIFIRIAYIIARSRR